VADRLVAYVSAAAVLEGRWVERARIEVDGTGTIAWVGADDPTRTADLVVDLGRSLLLPGFVNAHSHAFQRTIRGVTQRRGADDPSSFWSWRTAMYRAANELDPEAFEAVTRRTFTEMLDAGITCVGEFHYVHHQPGGHPYADANELSHRVVAAAREVGIRLVLLDTYYARAGAGQPAAPEQRRFCDADVESYLRRVDDLRGEGVDVAIVAHSVRAVGRADLERLAAYARAHDLPIHAHVSEQPRENEECRAEHGRSPMQVLDTSGWLDRPRRFTAVHAVFTDAEDRRLLGPQHVCACPTTESDLGDGIVPAAALRAEGCHLALGSDSNAVIDLVQEARLLEQNERLASGARLRLCDDEGRLWPTLLDAATRHGASSLGLDARVGRLTPGHAFDAVTLDLQHRSLSDVPIAHALDAVFTAGTAAPVRHVFVGGVRRR
jgi:formimidoylglutamate deiminase